MRIGIRTAGTVRYYEVANTSIPATSAANTPATAPTCPACGDPTDLDPVSRHPLLCATCDAINRN